MGLAKSQYVFLLVVRHTAPSELDPPFDASQPDVLFMGATIAAAEEEFNDQRGCEDAFLSVSGARCLEHVAKVGMGIIFDALETPAWTDLADDQANADAMVDMLFSALEGEMETYDSIFERALDQVDRFSSESTDDWAERSNQAELITLRDESAASRGCTLAPIKDEELMWASHMMEFLFVEIMKAATTRRVTDAICRRAVLEGVRNHTALCAFFAGKLDGVAPAAAQVAALPAS